MKTLSVFIFSLLAVAMSQAVVAATANIGALPPVHSQGDITYITGGIGQPESTAMKAAAGRYDLALMFADRSREFLADVKVDITDSRGNTVLDITSGPILLANLPDGTYRVRAEVGGVPRVQTVNVRGSHHQQLAYIWPNGIDQRSDFAAFEVRPMASMPTVKSTLETPVPMHSSDYQYGGGLDHVSDGLWSTE